MKQTVYVRFRCNNIAFCTSTFQYMVASDECFIGVCDAQWCLCTYEHQTIQTQTQILDLTEELFTDDAKSPSNHHIQKVFIFVFWSVASPGGPVCYCRLTFRYLHTKKT